MQPPAARMSGETNFSFCAGRQTPPNQQGKMTLLKHCHFSTTFPTTCLEKRVKRCARLVVQIEICSCFWWASWLKKKPNHCHQCKPCDIRSQTREKRNTVKVRLLQHIIPNFFSEFLFSKSTTCCCSPSHPATVNDLTTSQRDLKNKLPLSPDRGTTLPKKNNTLGHLARHFFVQESS